MLSKTTQKNVNHLTSIFEDLQQAHRFLHSERVKICTPGRSMPKNTYINPDNVEISPICKKAGSELQYLGNAIQKLRKHIEQAGRTSEPEPKGIKS